MSIRPTPRDESGDRHSEQHCRDHHPISAIHGLCGDQTRQAHDVGDRQVEGSAEDDERLSDSYETEHAHTGEDVADVSKAEEIAARCGDEYCRDDEHDDQGDIDQSGGIEMTQSSPHCSVTT